MTAEGLNPDRTCFLNPDGAVENLVENLVKLIITFKCYKKSKVQMGVQPIFLKLSGGEGMLC